MRELLILCKILYSYQSKKAKLTSNEGLYNNKFRVLSKLVALSLSVLVLFFSNLDVLYLQDWKLLIETCQTLHKPSRRNDNFVLRTQLPEVYSVWDALRACLQTCGCNSENSENTFLIQIANKENDRESLFCGLSARLIESVYLYANRFSIV